MNKYLFCSAAGKKIRNSGAKVQIRLDKFPSIVYN